MVPDGKVDFAVGDSFCALISIQDDFAKLFAFFHAHKCLGRLVQRKYSINHRLNFIDTYGLQHSPEIFLGAHGGAEDV